MDTKERIDARLAALGKDRQLLADQTGYSYFSVRDSLAPAGKPLSKRMERAFSETLGLFLDELFRCRRGSVLRGPGDVAPFPVLPDAKPPGLRSARRVDPRVDRQPGSPSDHLEALAFHTGVLLYRVDG